MLTVFVIGTHLLRVSLVLVLCCVSGGLDGCSYVLGGVTCLQASVHLQLMYLTLSALSDLLSVDARHPIYTGYR